MILQRFQEETRMPVSANKSRLQSYAFLRMSAVYIHCRLQLKRLNITLRDHLLTDGSPGSEDLQEGNKGSWTLCSQSNTESK